MVKGKFLNPQKSLGMRMSCMSCSSIQPRMPVNHLYLPIHFYSVAARYLVYPHHHHQQQQHKHQHQQQEPTTTITTISPYTTTNHKPEIWRSIFCCWSSLDALQLPGAPRLLLPHCSAVDFVDALPWEGDAWGGNPILGDTFDGGFGISVINGRIYYGITERWIFIS